LNFTILLTALILVGCLLPQQHQPWIRITNDTDESVNVLAIDATGRQYPVATLVPGEATTTGALLDPATGCMSLVLDAHGEDGRLIDTQEAPMCDGGEWLIQAREE
jgi:hypothetical protein